MLGSKLGERYRIVAEIGQGGMATVYRGVDEVLGRDVAIKVLHAHLARDSELCTRFQQEASIAARLDHPNIVKIYDYGQDEQGRGFIISELIKGQNLHKLHVARLKAGHGLFHPAVSAMIVEEILKGLCSAHEMNVIHRDVKPDNVMISRRGVVKLADFGIAKNISSNLTMAGKFLGSPSYSSPEQVQGLELGFRTDLFSTGIILYELLTDQLPFRGRSSTDVMLKISKGEHELLGAVAPHLPHQLVALVETALRLDPAARFPSTQAMIDEVRSYLRSCGVANSRAGLEDYARDPAEFERSLQSPNTSLERPRYDGADRSTPPPPRPPASDHSAARQPPPPPGDPDHRTTTGRATRFGITDPSLRRTASPGLHTLSFRRQSQPQGRPLRHLGTSERKTVRRSRGTPAAPPAAVATAGNAPDQNRATLSLSFESELPLNLAPAPTLDVAEPATVRTELRPRTPTLRRRTVQPPVRVRRRVSHDVVTEHPGSFGLLVALGLAGALIFIFMLPAHERREVPPVTRAEPVTPEVGDRIIKRTPAPPVVQQNDPRDREGSRTDVQPPRPDPTQRPRAVARAPQPTVQPRREPTVSSVREPTPLPRQLPVKTPPKREEPQSVVVAARPNPSTRIGALIVRTVPGDLPVLINGVEKPPAARTATSATFEVPPGKSRLTIRPTVVGGTKYQGFEKDFFVRQGDVLDAGLIRLRPVRTLRLRIRGPGIVAKINGDPYTVRSGALDLELPEGRVELDVRSSSGKTLQRAIQLQGDDVTLEASLE